MTPSQRYSRIVALSLFLLRMNSATSTAKTPRIRRGCPQSNHPTYSLFVLLIYVMYRDVVLNLHQRRDSNKLPAQRMSYADDTVLISTNTEAANRLLDIVS